MTYMTDVFDAAYRVAHDFKPDGAVGLARRLGKNPGTFLNKLNPHQETHHLTLGEAVLLPAVPRDTKFLLQPALLEQFFQNPVVANFGGGGRILSFYAPYRCDYCDDDRKKLLETVDRFHKTAEAKANSQAGAVGAVSDS